MTASTYDGRPCKVPGHGTLRYSSNSTCVTCNNSMRKASLAKRALERGTRYCGRVCEKHPESNGERMSSSGVCVKCLNEKSRERQKNNGYPVMKRQVQRLKEAVYEHYGRQCSCCGESDLDVLTVDHVNQDGANHKSTSGVRYRGVHLYRWLRANEFPDGFRVLCFNCNIKAYRNHTKLKTGT